MSSFVDLNDLGQVYSSSGGGGGGGKVLARQYIAPSAVRPFNPIQQASTQRDYSTQPRASTVDRPRPAASAAPGQVTAAVNRLKPGPVTRAVDWLKSLVTPAASAARTQTRQTPATPTTQPQQSSAQVAQRLRERRASGRTSEQAKRAETEQAAQRLRDRRTQERERLVETEKAELDRYIEEFRPMVPLPPAPSRTGPEWEKINAWANSTGPIPGSPEYKAIKDAAYDTFRFATNLGRKVADVTRPTGPSDPVPWSALSPSNYSDPRFSPAYSPTVTPRPDGQLTPAMRQSSHDNLSVAPRSWPAPVPEDGAGVPNMDHGFKDFAPPPDRTVEKILVGALAAAFVAAWIHKGD